MLHWGCSVAVASIVDVLLLTCRQEEAAQAATAKRAAGDSHESSGGDVSTHKHQRLCSTINTPATRASSSSGSICHLNNNSSSSSRATAEQLGEHHMETSGSRTVVATASNWHHGSHHWAVSTGYCHSTKQGKAVLALAGTAATNPLDLFLMQQLPGCLQRTNSSLKVADLKMLKHVFAPTAACSCDLRSLNTT